MGEETKSANWPNRTVNWVKSHGGKISTPLVGVFTVLCGVYGDSLFSEGLWAFILLIVFLALTMLLQFRKPSYTDLLQELDEAKTKSESRGATVERALSMLLQRLAEQCQTSSIHDRISVYYHTDGRFVMIARYSRNPEFNRPGRGEYPKHQGVIGKAWSETHGVARQELPATEDAWVKAATKNHGFDDESIARGIKMKSREIGAIRIEGDRTSVGMMVIESVERGHVRPEILDEAKASRLFEAISEFVDVSAPDTPRAAAMTANQGSLPSPDPWKSTKPPSEHKGTD